MISLKLWKVLTLKLPCTRADVLFLSQSNFKLPHECRCSYFCHGRSLKLPHGCRCSYFCHGRSLKLPCGYRCSYFCHRANFKIAAGVAVLEIRHRWTLKVLRVQMFLNNKQTHVFKSFSDIFFIFGCFLCIFRCNFKDVGNCVGKWKKVPT